jgi:hypothetical protein
MRKVIVHGAWLVAVAASIAGCASAAATSASGSPTLNASAIVQPSAANTAASNPSAAATSIASGPQYTAATASAIASASSAVGTGPLGLLPIPPGANAWTTNTDASMGLDAFIKQVYDSDSQAGEKSLYTQRGFVSGAFEGWFNPDGSQQSIAIARFASASGATYAFSDLSGSLQQNPAPDKVFTDSADGAVGSADPTVDSEGNAYTDITAHIGDYLVDVHEFSPATPDTSAAKALLLEQVDALKGGS